MCYNEVNNITLKEGKMKRVIKIIGALVILVLSLTGCSSLSTVMKKNELTTNTKMTDTIWLTPSNKKNIFVQIRNVTNYNLNIELGVKTTLLNKGYNIVANPDKADYWLQGNILKVEKVDLKPEESQATSGLLGAGVGAGVGAYNTESANTAIALGLLGGAAGIALDSFTEDTQYMMMTEILLTENPNNSRKKEHSTKIYSIANKMNLKLEEATPVLEKELEKTISNIF